MVTEAERKIMAAVDDYRSAVKLIAASEIGLLFVANTPSLAHDGLLEALLRRVSLNQQPPAQGSWESLLSCDRGWYAIITALNVHLASVDPDYQIHQIKEKVGGLRFYATMRSPADQDPTELAAFDALIAEAELLAWSTCEQCSMPGGLCRLPSSWYKTLCADCASEKGCLAESGRSGT